MKPVAYCKPNEANAKRAQAKSRPTCRVDNYGLARKNTLLSITERINRQCYDLYKVDRTEWLVNENESIGVQEKHKQELGIITQEFFKPSFKGAPEPLLDGPVVRKAVNISNSPVCCDAKVCNEKPKDSGAYKIHSLRNLLNNENVQLIDSKELQNRFKTAGSRITTRKYKVDKAKERTKTLNETRKKTPQEVLRACNRPKSQGKVKPPKMPWRENKNITPDIEQSTRPKAIKYKQTDTLLPINEDVRKFYERNKCVEPKRRLPVEPKKNQQNRNCENCLQKSVPTSELNNKKVIPQWKLGQELKAKVKLNDSNRKKSETAQKNWKNALNIKLDKMNKKLPVGNTKRRSSSHSNSSSSRSQSSSDPDKTPRPNYSSDPDKTPTPRSPRKPDRKRKPLTSSENRDLKETIFQNNRVESREQHNLKQTQKAIAQLENLGLFLDKIEKNVKPEDIFNEQAEVLKRKNIGILKQKERVEKETRAQVRDASKKDLMVNKKIVKGTNKQGNDPRYETKEIKQKLLLEDKIKQKDKIERTTKEKEKLEQKVLRQNKQKAKTENYTHELNSRRKILKNNKKVLIENKLIEIEQKDKIKNQIKEQVKDCRRVFVKIRQQGEHEAADANKENIKTEGKDCRGNKPKEHLEDLIKKILSSKRERNREEVDFDFESLNLEQLKRLIIKLKNIHIIKKQFSMGGIKTKSLKRLKKRSRKKLSEYKEESKEFNIPKEGLSGKFIKQKKAPIDGTENLKPIAYNVEKKKTAVVEGLRPMRPLFSNKEIDARRTELARQLPANLRKFCQKYIEQIIEHKLSTLAEADSSSSIVVRNLQIANEVQFAKIQPYPKLGIRREYDLSIISRELDCVLSLEAPNLRYERYSLCDTIQRFLFCLYFLLFIFILFIVFAEMNPIYWRWLLRRVKRFFFYRYSCC
ncbi:uncharacterized protein Dvir_GJ26451 [Drosophila virilis]|uniref:Uncharacterized protein n=1 Tax=Drosophila virilis TaxID=7244 RepID=A0A0Q9WK44_DROVI|nr:uncharacterized protein Dvir_GJ26451 [Drosophila virilis]